MFLFCPVAIWSYELRRGEPNELTADMHWIINWNFLASPGWVIIVISWAPFSPPLDNRKLSNIINRHLFASIRSEFLPGASSKWASCLVLRMSFKGWRTLTETPEASCWSTTKVLSTSSVSSTSTSLISNFHRQILRSLSKALASDWKTDASREEGNLLLFPVRSSLLAVGNSLHQSTEQSLGEKCHEQRIESHQRETSTKIN